MTRARKRFGQHFLEPVWVTKVVRAIDPQPGETFLEIGPGHGALTRSLLRHARAVVAFEIDRDLAAELRQLDAPNLTLVEGDFLHSTWLADHPPMGLLRVAGNLPYNVASPILFALARLYAAGAPLVDATLMLQREVADRLGAGPGTRRYGVLSVLMQHVASVERLLVLPPGAFRPAPKVHSALVRLRYHPPQPPATEPKTFAALVQAIFTRRRKTLANALLAFSGSERVVPAIALERASIDGRRRPETLTITELVGLAEQFSEAPQPSGSLLP